MCYSPLMQGLLTGKYKAADDFPANRGRTRHFSSSRKNSKHGQSGHEELLFDTLVKIEAISKASGISMVDLSLSWPLLQPTVASVIVGVTKQEQLPANCDGSSRTIPADVLKELDIATEELKMTMGSNIDLWQGGDNSRCN